MSTDAEPLRPPREPPAPAPGRRRDPAVHRAAILQAARESLSDGGYAGMTIRDVARRAGVTHGLVMRHFGSKERLVAAALPPVGLLQEAMTGTPGTLPERLAHAFVSRMDADAAAEPLVALIRSTGNEAVTRRLLDEMRGGIASALSSVLGRDPLGERIDLIGAVIIGITFERYVVGGGTLAAMSAEALEDHLAGLVRHILGPALPADG